MNNEALVSIIIPSFNRAHLIGETLDSIISQTYTNWECIVVDDGSTDDTVQILKTYSNRYTRFKYYKRPENRLKGANACRNIGLQKAIGDYVVFFDSDDLMTPEHIFTKVEGMQAGNFDYVITKTKYFNINTNKLDYCYRFNEFELTPYNYVLQHINWLTYDVCIKRELAQSITFNEMLQSGQEYNYFSKLVHQSCNAKYIDTVVTLRRFHENSIRSQLDSDQKRNTSSFQATWLTYKDIKHLADERTSRELIKNTIAVVYRAKVILTDDKFVYLKGVFKEMGFQKGMYFLLMLCGLKVFNRGYWCRQQINKDT